MGQSRAIARRRARRVYVLIGPQHFLLGPRIAQTFDALCAAIVENDHE